MELECLEESKFTLTASAEEMEAINAGLSRMALQGATEDFERARAHERLGRIMPQPGQPWEVTLSTIELIALQRATLRVEYEGGHTDSQRETAKVFNLEFMGKAQPLGLHLSR